MCKKKKCRFFGFFQGTCRQVVSFEVHFFLAGHADKLFYHIEFANGVQPVSAALGKYSGPCFNVSLTAAGSDLSHVVDNFPLSGV